MRLCSGLVLLAATAVHAIDFSQWKNCKDCTGAGYGWCTIRRKCGGFANKDCGDHEGEVYYTEDSYVAPPTDCVVLTDDNFNANALNPATNALVEFYAPWCGHCKALKPAYEKVCTAFKNEPDVVVAHMDATKFDSGNAYGVKGFPTLKFFPAGSSDEPEFIVDPTAQRPDDWDDEDDGEWRAPMIDNPKFAKVQDYNGGREAEDFITFLNSKAGTHRVVGGKLEPDAGLISELDAIVADFYKAASGDTRAKLLAQAEGVTAVGNSKTYVKMLKKVDASGHKVVSAERARLTGLIEGGKVKTSQVKKFEERLNILDVFERANSVS